MRRIFIHSDYLLNRIKCVTDEVSTKSNGLIVFDEYITCPHYGFIILRFDLKDKDCTLEKLTDYEEMIYDCVKDEFMIDFLGSVYEKFGLKRQNFAEVFRKCYDKYSSVEIIPSVYYDKIRKDAVHLLNICNFDKKAEVWEIQYDKEILLFILNDSFEMLGTFVKDELTIKVFHVNRRECEGLVKALFYARKNKISLVKVLLEA